MKNKRMLAGPYLFWSVSFVVIPLLVIVYYAFTSDEGTFTFLNLAQITTPENLKALGMSLLLSFLSTLICLVLAYPLAMILSQKQVNQTSFIVLIFILPMWMNFLLRTLAWQTLLEKNGVVNSILGFFHLPALEIISTPYAIILGMVYNFLPFMVLPIYNVRVPSAVQVAFLVTLETKSCPSAGISCTSSLASQAVQCLLFSPASVQVAALSTT